MTFDEILAIIRDKTRTDFQQAADLHAAITKASTPSALNIKPKQERKKRAQKAPGIKGGNPGDLLNGFAGHSENEGGVQ